MPEGTIVGAFFFFNPFDGMIGVTNSSKEIQEAGHQLESTDLAGKEGMQNVTQRTIYRLSKEFMHYISVPNKDETNIDRINSGYFYQIFFFYHAFVTSAF